MFDIRRTLHLVTCLCFVMLIPVNGIAWSNDLEKQKESLDIIEEFAGKICQEIPLGGHSENLELTGTAKIELNSLLKKLVDLGIEGAVKYEKSEWKGVLQDDIIELLRINTDCRLEIWRDLKERLIPNINSEVEIQGAQKLLNQTYRTIKYKSYYGQEGVTSINIGQTYTVYNEIGCGGKGRDILKIIIHKDGTIQAYNKDCDKSTPILGRRTYNRCSEANYGNVFFECCADD